MKNNLTYEQAIAQLESIVNDFERDTLALDQLTAKVAEAQELIRHCKAKLSAVEQEAKKMLDDGKE